MFRKLKRVAVFLTRIAAFVLSRSFGKTNCMPGLMGCCAYLMVGRGGGGEVEHLLTGIFPVNNFSILCGKTQSDNLAQEEHMGVA